MPHGPAPEQPNIGPSISRLPLVISNDSSIETVPVTAKNIRSLEVPGPHPFIVPWLLCAVIASGKLHIGASSLSPLVVLTRITLARGNPDTAMHKRGHTT